MRYFTQDPRANGITDFKGETEWMDTEQRITFLTKYADYASTYFENKNFNKEIVTDTEIRDLLSGIKPQPLTSIRKTIPLDRWKSYGYKNGQDTLKKKEIESWEKYQGVSISGGEMLLDNTIISRKIDSLVWRFKFECKINTVDNSMFTLKFSDGKHAVMSFGIQKGKLNYGSGNNLLKMSIDNPDWTDLIIEGDLSLKMFNLYVNGKIVQYYIPMMDSLFLAITDFTMSSEGKTRVDDIFIFNHHLTGNVKSPYISKVLIDENFEDKPPITDWQDFSFNDSHWVEVNLPAAHGGLREKEEAFYLRKKVYIGNFERATLKLETLDPGGEVWVNNEVVAVIHTRHPYDLDVTKYLKRNQENLIAVKVDSYKMHFPMNHAPTDHYIGWFLGRTTLVLSSMCMIDNVQVTTRQIGEQAVQSHKIKIQYRNYNYFEGNIEINYYPWFPEEEGKVASYNQDIKVRPRIDNEYVIECSIPSPKLWNADSPNLYKVEIILKDKNGNPVDDFVTTSGIRTIEQKNGDLYINGKQEMLNGAQIIGFRTPIETISKTNRCAPWEIVAEEMLMIKKMSANLLRMHVHAERDTTDGINDPRYAEFADQMGIYLIWSTAAWTREGEVWNVDFEGYPLFMKQVYNHPSIVIWEASNHPNRFKEHDISDSDDFVKKIYNTIYPVDQSRLISPTTIWKQLHYANNEGTIDYQGNKIEAVPEFTAPGVTRGSQDSYTGYGKDWSVIRNAPNDWAASCLKSKDKAYFNFEHEESAAQPNWNLCKGKPWYLIQSYEWDYDIGSIGRRLTTDEWKASQAWQAFSAWESMKKQILLGYDGFSWCCLHGGPNMGTYQKALIDNLRHPKLAYYVNKMVFQKDWAGSNDVDVVYGPADSINPVINHLGNEQLVDLVLELKDLQGKVLDKKIFKNIDLQNGHTINQLEGFRFKNVKDGIYVVNYELFKNKY
ncbi:MAG: hypothetical protein Q7T80_18220 [Methanoregula sp.]|nr:hypothetical protein [Methanoregula sp.]